MPISPKDVFTDPQFKSLTPEQRRQVLVRIDPEYAKLSPEQQMQVASFQWKDTSNIRPDTAVDKMFPTGGTLGVPHPRTGMAGIEDDLANLRTRLSQFSQKGVGQGPGDYMMSLPLGLLRAMKGQTEFFGEGKLWEGTKDTVGGTLEASQIPGSFVGPEVSQIKEAGPMVVEQAAREITNAINPAQKMTGFEEMLAKHLDKIVTFAAQKGINLDSAANLSKAMKEAGLTIREHYFDAILKPFKNVNMDVSALRGYAGETSTPSTATLGQMDNRLRVVNALLNPKYNKASDIAASAAVKSAEDLNIEAASLREALYGKLGDLTGLGKETIADMNQAFGQLRDLGEVTQKSAEKARFASNKIKNAPISVNPFSKNDATTFVADKALAKLQGDTIGRAISKVMSKTEVPRYRLAMPKRTEGAMEQLMRRPPIRGGSTPIGTVSTPSPEEVAALADRLKGRKAAVNLQKSFAEEERIKRSTRVPLWKQEPPK